MEEQVRSLINHIRRNVEFYLNLRPNAKEVSILNLDKVVSFEGNVMDTVSKQMIGMKIGNKIITDVFVLVIDGENKVFVTW